MVVTFRENEDIGKVKPIIIKMKNFIVEEWYDDMLTIILQIALYTIIGAILYILFKRESLI